MTCASCANRIERTLNKLDGVTATVNYAEPRRSRPTRADGTSALDASVLTGESVPVEVGPAVTG